MIKCLIIYVDGCGPMIRAIILCLLVAGLPSLIGVHGTTICDILPPVNVRWFDASRSKILDYYCNCLLCCDMFCIIFMLLLYLLSFFIYLFIPFFISLFLSFCLFFLFFSLFLSSFLSFSLSLSLSLSLFQATKQLKNDGIEI